MKEHFAFEDNIDSKEECENLFEIAAKFIQDNNPDLSDENTKEASILISRLLNEYFKEKASRLGIPDVNAYLARAWTLDD